MFRNFSLTLLLLLLALVFPWLESFAQEASRPDRGMIPNGSYSISDIENINLLNGNVNVHIPLASLPPIAGGKLSWTVSAQYNSKIWDVTRYQENEDPLTWAPYTVNTPGAAGGWSIGSRYVMVFRNANDDFQRLWYPGNSNLPQWELNLLNNYQWWKVVLRMPDGSEHEFRPTDSSSYIGTRDFLRGFYNTIPNGNATRYYSVDGTYMFACITTNLDWTVYLPDGTQVIQSPDGIQRIQDTNGNKIKIFSDSDGTHYRDEQTSREIRVVYNASTNNYQVWYKTVQGIPQHIDVNFGTTTVRGKLYPVNVNGCDLTGELFAQLEVVREIVFPQTEPGLAQRKFTFSYNSDSTTTATDPAGFSCPGGGENYTRTVSHGFGELSRIEMPSGAIIDYSYSYDGVHSLAPSAITDILAQEEITEKKITHDGIFDRWTYDIGDGLAIVTDPDGAISSESAYCSLPNTPGCSADKSGLTYRSVRPFSRVERHWTNLIFSGADIAAPNGVVAFNPVIDKEYTTLIDAQGNALKMSARVFAFDFNGNVIQETQYDWFDPSLVSRDAVGVPTGVPSSATVLNVITYSHYYQAATVSSANVYAKRSISNGAPLILNAPKETTLGARIVQFSYDQQGYGVAPTIGNLTTKKVWDDLDAKWITTSNTYDSYGNVTTATDARGKVTSFFYDDSTHALPNRVVVDPENGTGAQTTTTAYDFSTGLVTSQTDVNGQVTTIDYTNQLLGAVDPFGRPGITKSPTINIDDTNHRRRVTTTYLDATRQVILETDLNGEDDKLLKTRTTTDMLGRPVLSETSEDGTNYTILVRNAYLNMGQVTLSSSPMRNAAASTDGWTRVTKDTAGRVKEVATFGGAAQPAWTGTAGVFSGAVTTEYNGNFSTVTDQAGKVRRSVVDALGRLTEVHEPDASGNLGPTTAPLQKTEYKYDVFGNLNKVIQGVQERTFTYDSLSRLRTAINPESGTVAYQYDDNGNLRVKTDARAVSTHYQYDSINRVTRRWYNGSNSTAETTHNVPALPSGVGATDEVKFYYDSQPLPAGAPSYTRGSAVGRLVAQTYGTGTAGDYYAYDVLGRQNLKIQQTGASNYQVSAEYTLSGGVSSLTYPSGHIISNTYDQAGRLTAFSGNLGDGTTRIYSTGTVYSSLGSLLKEQFGTTTPVYHKLHYNSRAQLCDVRASNVNDEWGGELGAIVNFYSTPFVQCGNGSDNNGNLLMSQTIINSSVYFEDRYSYDSLNRLTTVNEYLNGSTFSGKQEYDYDRWGNRTLKPASTLGTYKEFTVNTANNRLGVPPGQPPSVTMSYDNAGNLSNDTYTGAGNRTYDAEDKIISAWGGNNQAQLYGYDASGQRVKRTVNGVETWQVYGFGGELLAEYPANGAATSAQKEYGYRNGQLLVTAEPGASNMQAVVWSNVMGVSVSGNTLTKTGVAGWNAGAVSTQTITSGAGYVEFTASETNLARMCGLGNGDSGQDYTDIEFAIQLTASDGTNGVWIFESGTLRGDFGTYSVGDKFRVAVEGGVVKYYKISGANQTLLYTSTVAPTYPLLVDTSLYSTSSTLTSVVISKAPDVSFTNATGVSISGNTLTKTGVAGWNGGAVSAQTITSGDGYVEFTASETNLARMGGLGNGDSGQNYTDIEFAIQLTASDGTNGVWVFESGTLRGNFGTYSAGDKFGVAVESGVVKYKKNGTVFYTSSLTPTYPLLVDTSLYSTGSTVTNIVLVSGTNAPPSQVQWLVSDQLGTPRMIIDQTGTAANVKRHDYLPFGEELFGGTNANPGPGGRKPNLGYGCDPSDLNCLPDSVRQQFTLKERDVETGLDYFEARYYASIQGRFTSIDLYNIVMERQYATNAKKAESHFTSYLSNPQRWARYTYALNNPLLYTDPHGEDVTIYYRPPREGAGSKEDYGHIFVYVRNDETGESAYFDYVADGYPPTVTYLNNVDQDRINAHASLTIETTADQEQAILGGIKEMQKSSPDYQVSLGAVITGCESTCTSQSVGLLRRAGINFGGIAGHQPSTVWQSAFAQYSNESLSFQEKSFFRQMITPSPIDSPNFNRPATGVEYGRDPRGQARTLDTRAINNIKIFFRGGKRVEVK